MINANDIIDLVLRLRNLSNNPKTGMNHYVCQNVLRYAAVGFMVETERSTIKLIQLVRHFCHWVGLKEVKDLVEEMMEPPTYTVRIVPDASPHGGVHGIKTMEDAMRIANVIEDVGIHATIEKIPS